MRKDRLLKLADYLETVPRERFDMQMFGNGKSGCGFAGCAVGWATHAKMFRGLKFTAETDGSGYPLVSYNGHLDWGGLEELFEVDAEVLQDELFGYKLTGTPKQVAKRIRKFVKADAP